MLNIPLIEYTLEWLACNQVDEVGQCELMLPIVFLFCKIPIEESYFRSYLVPTNNVALPLWSNTTSDMVLVSLEVIVFCCAHAKKITDYLESSKWSQIGESMKVTPIVAPPLSSFGDAMRFLDQSDIVKNDFILVSGDTVTNLSLAPIFAEHNKRRQKDKNALMTMVRNSSRPIAVGICSSPLNDPALNPVSRNYYALLLRGTTR